MEYTIPSLRIEGETSSPSFFFYGQNSYRHAGTGSEGWRPRGGTLRQCTLIRIVHLGSASSALAGCGPYEASEGFTLVADKEKLGVGHGKPVLASGGKIMLMKIRGHLFP
jgi:hypothetical protein